MAYSSSASSSNSAGAPTVTPTPTSASIVNMLPTTMMTPDWPDASLVDIGPPSVAESIINELATNASLAGPRRDEDLAKIEMAVLLIIFTLTLIGNSIVILGIYFRHQKMSRMYYFILHLSIADLITAFFNVAAQFFMELTWPEFIGNDFLCKFVKYAQILGPYSSSYVLVMTAMDRYQAICFPLSSYRWTTARSKIMLAVAWATALAFCVPQVFIFSLQETYPGIHDCYASFSGNWGAKFYVTWYSISFFIVPLILLIFAYTCICRTLWLNASMKNLIGKVEFKNNNGNDSPAKGRAGNHGRVLHTSSSRMSQDSTSSDEIIRQAVKKQLKKKPTEKRFLMNFRRKSNQKNAKKNEMLPNGLDEKEQRNELLGLESRIEPNGNVRSLLKSTSSSSPGSIRLTSRLYRGGTGRNHLSEPMKLRHYSSTGDEETTTTSDMDHRMAEEKLKEIMKGSEKYYGPNMKSTEAKSLLSYKSKFPGEALIQSNGHGTRGKPGGQLETTSSSGTEVAVRVGTDGGVTVNHQPRAHSTTGISRAKIKTIKLTITVIVCYIVCSSPFIAAQLWACYDPHASESPFYTGTTFTILVLLASLNSCVNPWIFLFFNPNLLEDFVGGITRRKLGNLHRQKSKTSANVTLRTWAGGGGSRRLQASPQPDSNQQNSLKKQEPF